MALQLGNGDEHHATESDTTGLNVKGNLYLYLSLLIKPLKEEHFSPAKSCILEMSFPSKTDLAQSKFTLATAKLYYGNLIRLNYKHRIVLYGLWSRFPLSWVHTRMFFSSLRAALGASCNGILCMGAESRMLERRKFRPGGAEH